MAGVTLGYRSLVGANSAVMKDVPDYTVVGGVPAKPMKQILPGEEGDPLREVAEAGKYRDPRLPE